MEQGPNHLKMYYKGVLEQIKIELEKTNDLIKHSGVKGDSNERLLRELLKRFLPKKYSVGSGMIYDKTGKTSKQIDLLIYDSFFHPNIYDQGSQPLFPIDIVYCAIEIKTRLDLPEAVKNIQSIKNLEIIEKEFRLPNRIIVNTNHPYGVIFSYNYDQEKNNFDTFKNRMKKIIQHEPDKHSLFDSCYIMSNTFFVRNVNLDDANEFECSFSIKFTDDHSNGDIHADGTKWECDQSRGFLMFLIDLLKLLSHKFLINEYIFDYYLDESDFYRYIDLIPNKEPEPVN